MLGDITAQSANAHTSAESGLADLFILFSRVRPWSPENAGR